MCACTVCNEMISDNVRISLIFSYSSKLLTKKNFEKKENFDVMESVFNQITTFIGNMKFILRMK